MLRQTKAFKRQLTLQCFLYSLRLRLRVWTDSQSMKLKGYYTISTKPRIIENIMVKSDFKRHNSTVSALRRSRRDAYEMWPKLFKLLVNLLRTDSSLSLRYTYLGDQKSVVRCWWNRCRKTYFTFFLFWSRFYVFKRFFIFQTFYFYY